MTEKEIIDKLLNDGMTIEEVLYFLSQEQLIK
jgi:hypothetical protein